MMLVKSELGGSQAVTYMIQAAMCKHCFEKFPNAEGGDVPYEIKTSTHPNEGPDLGRTASPSSEMDR